MPTLRVAVVATLMLSMLMPVHRLPLPAFYAEWIMGAGALVASLSCLSKAASVRLRFDGVVAVLGGLLCLISLQYLLGIAPWSALVFHGLYLALFFLAYQAGVSLSSSDVPESFASTAAAAFVLAALYSCLVAAFQLRNMRVPFDLVMPRVGGLSANIAQINRFNDLIWLGICSALYLVGQQKYAKPLLLLSLFLLLVFSILTGSRSGVVYALGIAALPWVLRCVALPVSWRNGDALLALAVFPLFLGLQFVLASLGTFDHFNLHSLAARAAVDFGVTGEVSSQLATPGFPRLELWRNLLPTMQTFGIGAGNFRFFMFENPDLWRSTGFDTPPEHAHNLFVHIGVELGWPALLLTITASLLWLWARRGKEISASVVWAVGMLFVMATHSMVEYPLWYLNFLMPFGLFLGMCALQTKAWKITHVSATSGSIACAVVLMILGLGYKDYHAIEDPLMSMQMGIVGIDQEWEALRSELKQIPDYSPYKGYAQLVRVMSVDARKFVASDILDDCDAAVRLWRSLPTLASCAATYQLTGNSDRARTVLTNACAAKPAAAKEIIERFRRFVPDTRSVSWLGDVCRPGRQ